MTHRIHLVYFHALRHTQHYDASYLQFLQLSPGRAPGCARGRARARALIELAVVGINMHANARRNHFYDGRVRKLENTGDPVG